ncbi:MAG: histidine kinase [Proteobacteria bacterium]|nr:histidine kinase [Pseudomonadota bacterium]
MRAKPETQSNSWLPSLRGRIYLLIAALVLSNLAGAVLTVWMTQRAQRLQAEVMERDLSAMIVAQNLETSLVMQKGYVTYYFLNGDPSWLKLLAQRHRAYENWLNAARASAFLPEALKILNEIESRYVRYAFIRDRVIDLYKEGRHEEGAHLHWEARDQFHAIYNLGEQYKELHLDRLEKANERFERESRILITIAWLTMPAVVLLGTILGFILYRQVLGPIRRLALDANGAEGRFRGKDEVEALSTRMFNLISDRNLAHSELEQSREHLVQAEKLAMVGKLAAGVAHSVRNPLTSVKMRLFSLERSLNVDLAEKEDFEVISEEIRHIDTILTNFLEFSRPPKLEKQRVCPSDVVDNSLQLIRHRLDSYGVEVTVKRRVRLPQVQADADQLKEVLMNLIFNACEVMDEGGRIRIQEEVVTSNANAKTIVIQVSDSGPGIPDSLRERIFDPFFSAKEQGSGLGLSIARRIMEDHGGRIDLLDQEGPGATFILTLPIKET